MARSDEILKLAEDNQRRAQEVIRNVGIVEAWQSIGAEINLIGSLRMGLMMTHRDIDFHVYTDTLDVADSFRAMSAIAANPSVKRVEYGNLSDTNEKCIEWHAWYEDEQGDEWQIDIIHILRGSSFDGYFERVGDKIVAVLTDEARNTILRLKYETPESDKISGIVYYRAVIEGGVRTYDELQSWIAANPTDGIILWEP